MQIITLTTKEELDELYNTGCWTWEGMRTDEENLKDIEEFFKKHGYEGEVIAKVFNGKLMNDTYKLTGSNRYKNDLTIMSIPNFYNPILMAQVGARWFDDIVDNNSVREK